VPSAIGYVLLGDLIIGGMYERGDFVRADTILVWLILGAYSIGLLASTATRLYASTLYALGDTRTPARIAMMRVAISVVIGATLMISLEPITWRGFTIGWREATLVFGHPIGAAGLAAGAGIASWIEWVLLRRALGRRIGDVSAGAVLARLIGAALLAGAMARGLFVLLPTMHGVLTLLLVLPVFGLVYFAVAMLLGVEEVSTAIRRVLARFGVRRV
jgi:putative peptidoglycan lipid II flippase